MIGVFGSSSDRRALVRTSGGRFVRVKVGDRLDGGKVQVRGSTADNGTVTKVLVNGKEAAGDPHSSDFTSENPLHDRPSQSPCR